MAERKPKAKPRDESGVLASLPATRPQRMGNRRRASKPAATERAVASSPRRKPAAKKRAPKAVPKPTPIAAKPKPVRSGASGLAEPAKKAATKRTPAPPGKAPSGTELVTTVVQAAGELAQVGLSIGGQVLKRAVERLPKP